MALEEGEESGDEMPDPPACNAPAPKAPANDEDGDGEEEDNEGDGEEGDEPVAEAWSGDDEDLIESTGKVRGKAEAEYRWEAVCGFTRNLFSCFLHDRNPAAFKSTFGLVNR